jgi:hypothetical protein
MDLIDAPTPLRTDLARLAILEMATAYADAAARARRDLRRRPTDRDLRRWAAAVSDLAAEMMALADSIGLTRPVEIVILFDQSLYLVAAGQAVVINAPRPREQRALERRIIERYCALNMCDPERFEQALPEPAPAPRAAMPRWQFTQGAGPVCETEDGLSFQFSTTEDLRRKRQACAQVVAELDRLAHALTREQANGTAIDWDALAIARPSDTDSLAVVNLNHHGGALRMDLPALAAGPEPFSSLRPWLAAKVRGTPYHLVVIHAEALMDSVPLPGGEVQ